VHDFKQKRGSSITARTDVPGKERVGRSGSGFGAGFAHDFSRIPVVDVPHERGVVRSGGGGVRRETQASQPVTNEEPRQVKDAALSGIQPMHRMADNQAIQGLLGPTVQSKLDVTPANSEHEREANRVADHVMRMPEESKESCECGGECADCGGGVSQGEVQMKRIGGGSATTAAATPPAIEKVLRSPATGLASGTRRSMEAVFGRDLGGVRIHTDATAAMVARAVHARAFTVGRDIAFGEGQFNPGTSAGRGLLAHELTHTIQQRVGLHMKRDDTIHAPAEEQEEELDDLTDQMEPERDEEVQAESEPEASDESADEADDLETGEMEMEQTEVEEQGPGPKTKKGGDADCWNPKKKPNHKRRKRSPGPGFGVKLAKLFRKGRSKKNATIFNVDDCFEFGAAPKSPKVRDPVNSILCVTRYKEVGDRRVDFARQPLVKNKPFTKPYRLKKKCTYVVRWDMRDVPDQIIITDLKTKAEIFNQGMISGEDEFEITGPRTIQVQVIPNDGTDNPDHSDTVYSFEILERCNQMQQIKTCYWLGVIPIGRKMHLLRKNPKTDYDKVRRNWVTRPGMKSFLR
jgi:hypothetical protein